FQEPWPRLASDAASKTFPQSIKMNGIAPAAKAALHDPLKKGNKPVTPQAYSTISAAKPNPMDASKRRQPSMRHANPLIAAAGMKPNRKPAVGPKSANAPMPRASMGIFSAIASK